MYDSPRIQALLDALDLDSDTEVEEFSYNDEEFEVDGGTYRVLSDDEADAAQDESIEIYIDDCLLPECDEDNPLYLYFDREAFKRDARLNGRGHSLAHYDHEELEGHDVNSTMWYVYRTN